jgi:uncharacterized protein (TIGR02453 family)
MAFQGFADDKGKFFAAVAKHQNRDWFQAHKTQFDEGWNGPMRDLLLEVRDAIDKAYRYCELDEPKIFRLYRDVRFSKDKSPYKTHLAGLIPIQRAGKMTEVPAALYFHVGQPHAFAAAGHYMMDSEVLDRFRKAVADDKSGRRLARILSELQKKGFSAESHGTYARVPKGYDPAHPRADHLKRKGLTVTFPAIPKGYLAKAKLVPWLATQAKAAAPLVEWLVFATA